MQPMQLRPATPQRTIVPAHVARLNLAVEDLGPGGMETLDHCHVTVGRGIVDHVGPAPRLGVNVGATRQQGVDNGAVVLLAAQLDRQEERRVVVVVEHLEVCPVVQQPLDA